MKRHKTEVSVLVCLLAALLGFSLADRCIGNEPPADGAGNANSTPSLVPPKEIVHDTNRPKGRAVVHRDPEWFRLAYEGTGRAVEINPVGPTVVVDRFAATEQSAKTKTRELFKRTVKNWLGSDASRDWSLPDAELNRLVLEEYTAPFYSDVGVVYLTGFQTDLSQHAKSRVLELYQNDLARQRLYWIGGIVTFVLVCLGSMGGYIRADEATKGYYTNRLRLAAAAAVGAAGFAIYHLVA